MSRPIRLGALYGALFGLIFFSIYAGISWWICIGLRECASGWAPYIAVIAFGLALGSLAGAVIVAAAVALYRVTKL